jgi:hypothetical protein
MELAAWLQTGATVVLVVVTCVYVYLTRRLLDSAVQQARLASNPVIGITITSMYIGSEFGPRRRNFNVEVKLTNVGNAPAIEVLLDAEIILQYSAIDGEDAIPSRFEPSSIAFLRPGEEVEDNFTNCNFGDRCITHLFDDFREYDRLNTLRIETDPSQPAHPFSELVIYVYYKNNLGQYFASKYQTHLGLDEIPPADGTADLRQIYVPRPEFHAGPTTEQAVASAIRTRNERRALSGW